MTDQEYEAGLAQLTAVDTECDALDQQQRDCIAKAREFNDAGRAARNKATGLREGVRQLREALMLHAQEKKRQLVEKAKAEAEAKAASEAKLPKPPTSAELMAEIQSLKAQLAAK